VVSGQQVVMTRVEDVNLACALLAHEVAGNPTAGMKMIGITGTKGKTTVAYLMRSVLKAAGHRVGMIGTVEIDDGAKAVPADMTTPGSVELVELFCRMRANGVTHCVMEVSSHALDQQRVAGIDWAVAIFTNLTGDHLDYHKTMEEYAAAKARLFVGLKEGAVAVVNADDAWVEQMVCDCPARVIRYQVIVPPKEGRLISPQTPGEDGWVALMQGVISQGTRLHVRCPAKSGGVIELNTPLVGKHNAYNLLAVLVALGELDVGVYGPKGDIVLESLEKARGAPGRLQQVKSTLPIHVTPAQYRL